MTVRIIISFLVLALFGTVSHAQDTAVADRPLRKGQMAVDGRMILGDGLRTPGRIQVYEDRRIARLDSLKALNPSKIRGYRVQIFFGERTQAARMRAAFSTSHPDVPTYISYLAPNFRLRVGDFRSRIAAEKLKHEIRKDYRSCYIVNDEIELPKLGGDERE